MTLISPAARPKQSREATEAILEKHGVKDACALVGVRGYYLHTIGDPEKNDIGVYDDAIFLIAPEFYCSFNANTDPALYNRGTAILCAGLYRYKLGIHGLSKPEHRRYRALVQSEHVLVNRVGGQQERGFFGINIHRGGQINVGSEGCQTIIASQWDAFIESVQDQMRRNNQRTIPYLLIEN